jgi:predicted DNA-binding protein
MRLVVHMSELTSEPTNIKKQDRRDIAMSILKRQNQPSGTTPRTFSIRLPLETYNRVVEWSYENRLTLSAGVSILINKAIEAETMNKPYIPEIEEEAINS